MPSWKSLDAKEAGDLVAFLISVSEPVSAAKEQRTGSEKPEKSAP
jgi:hypothetical protein